MQSEFSTYFFIFFSAGGNLIDRWLPKIDKVWKTDYYVVRQVPASHRAFTQINIWQRDHIIQLIHSHISFPPKFNWHDESDARYFRLFSYFSRAYFCYITPLMILFITGFCWDYFEAHPSLKLIIYSCERRNEVPPPLYRSPTGGTSFIYIFHYFSVTV